MTKPELRAIAARHFDCVTEAIANWTADKVIFRRKDNVLMLTPDDQSGAFGIASLIRP